MTPYCRRQFFLSRFIMRLLKNYVLFIILLPLVILLNGCSLLMLPGVIIGSTFKLLGVALELAKKVPWWLWI